MSRFGYERQDRKFSDFVWRPTVTDAEVMFVGSWFQVGAGDCSLRQGMPVCRLRENDNTVKERSQVK